MSLTTSRYGLKMIQVLVGKQLEPFTIHRDLATASSAVFEKACNGKWKESESVLRLPDEKPDTFAQYVYWLYSGKLEISTDLGNDKSNQKVKFSEAFVPLSDLYVMGDMLLCRGLKNAIIDKVITLANKNGRFPIGMRERYFEKTTPECALQRLLVDFLVYESEPEGAIEQRMGPPTFWFKVVKGMVERIGNGLDKGRPWELDKCQYHEHKAGESCKKGKSK